MENVNILKYLKENCIFSFFFILGFISATWFLLNYYLYNFNGFSIITDLQCVIGALYWSIAFIPGIILNVIPYFQDHSSYGSMTFLSEVILSISSFALYVLLGAGFKKLYNVNKKIFWIVFILFTLVLSGVIFYSIDIGCFFGPLFNP